MRFLPKNGVMGNFATKRTGWGERTDEATEFRNGDARGRRVFIFPPHEVRIALI